MGFAQGVSGLNAATSNLDVIGNNIANAGTIGFKSGNVEFADVFAGSQVGLGTQVAALSQNFSSGTVQSSSRPLDLAIVSGDGFFRLTNVGGEVGYSRNGQFNMDKDGYIVNAGGMRLTGYQVGANGTLAAGSPSPLQMPTAPITPKATMNVGAQFDLAAGSKVITTPFDPTNSNTYNYANAVTVFDSLGASHELSTFFVKTGSNAWDVYATADGQTLTTGGGLAAAPPAVPGTIGSATFDSNGVLTAPAGGLLSFANLQFANGSSPMPVTMNITGTTQFMNVNAVRKLTQDGYSSGQLSSFAITQDGVILGKYSNEQSMTLGQVVLTSFLNPNGLESKGENVWAETRSSGQPLVGTPGAGTKLGALASGALEQSNVDLTAELVNLIIAQRNYQANAQTVKTQDQAMQTLMNMR